MIPTSKISYEFGGFVLNPTNRQLTHFYQPVDLSGKDFDLLWYLVRNPNVLVPTAALIDAVWGPDTEIHHRGNITNHIAKVRKVLGCDPHNPTFIRTVHGKRGYRFIKPVNEVAQEIGADLKVETRPHADEFHVRLDIFVPIYMGPGLFSEMKSPERESQWLKYKEYKIDSGRLCILASGIAVWHLRYESSFSTFTNAAAWRKKLYEEIFQKQKHVLNLHTDQLLAPLRSEKQTLFQSVLGKPSYAYSVMTLQSPTWKNPEKIRKVLEVLACPKALESKNDSQLERERLRILERRFLEHGLNSLDMREFGMSGDDLGFASWEGLSYYHFYQGGDEAVDNLVEFQIALHSLWWLSKCLSDISLSNANPATEQLQKYLPDLRRQLLKIKNIEAKESTSQRTMIEAVVSVNRLEQIVDEALEAAT